MPLWLRTERQDGDRLAGLHRRPHVPPRIGIRTGQPQVTAAVPATLAVGAGGRRRCPTPGGDRAGPGAAARPGGRGGTAGVATVGSQRRYSPHERRNPCRRRSRDGRRADPHAISPPARAAGAFTRRRYRALPASADRSPGRRPPAARPGTACRSRRRTRRRRPRADHRRRSPNRHTAAVLHPQRQVGKHDVQAELEAGARPAPPRLGDRRGGAHPSGGRRASGARPDRSRATRPSASASARAPCRDRGARQAVEARRPPGRAPARGCHEVDPERPPWPPWPGLLVDRRQVPERR